MVDLYAIVSWENLVKPIMAAKVYFEVGFEKYKFDLKKYHTKDEYRQFFSKLNPIYIYVDIDLWFRDDTHKQISHFINDEKECMFIYPHTDIPSYINDEKLPHKLKVFTNGRLCPYELLEILERSEYKRFTSHFLFRLCKN